MVFEAMGGIEIATAIFITLSFIWNIVQAYVFIQERYKPPEDREHFEALKSWIFAELAFGW